MLNRELKQYEYWCLIDTVPYSLPVKERKELKQSIRLLMFAWKEADPEAHRAFENCRSRNRATVEKVLANAPEHIRKHFTVTVGMML